MTSNVRVVRQSDEIEIARHSANPSVAIAKVLDWLLEISLDKKELSQRESDFWIYILRKYPPDLIECAGVEWPQRSKFFPRPAEMIALLDELRAVKSRDLQATETESYLRQLRENRKGLAAQGLSSGIEQLHEVMRTALEKVKQFPALPDPDRRMELKERLARAEKERAARQCRPPAENGA